MTIAFVSRIPPDVAQGWLDGLRAAMPAEEILTGGAASDAEVAVVANPAPGALSELRNLAFVQGALAGVDSLLGDESFPARIPLARLVDPALAEAMGEAALTHVLMVHRQAPLYRMQQNQRVWRPHPQPRAHERRVGLLGLGEMGREIARRLTQAGFSLSGWSRSGSPVPGLEVFGGDQGLAEVLARSEIVVNVLPLTPQTRGILDRKAFAQMPRGAAVVNLARGGHVVAPDLIQALDEGWLAHAVLDVFEVEPLDASSPLWTHPSVTITPHVAAVTDVRTAAPLIAQNIARFRAGEPLVGLVSRDRGY